MALQQLKKPKTKQKKETFLSLLNGMPKSQYILYQLEKQITKQQYRTSQDGHRRSRRLYMCYIMYRDLSILK